MTVEEKTEEQPSSNEEIEVDNAAATAANDDDLEKQVAQTVEVSNAPEEVNDDGDANGEDKHEVKKPTVEEDIPWMVRMKEVFWTYLPLGFVAFGGPQAHIAILRNHLVVQRNWLDEDQFTELFAIGQGLPGPTSTQLVVSTALARAGPIGGL